jgi:hypothetical protein
MSSKGSGAESGTRSSFYLVSVVSAARASITATSTSASKPHFCQPLSTSIMSSLLHVAYRVEAAAKAYSSIKEHADQVVWKARFSDEKVCTLFRRFIDLISVFN